MKYIVKLQFKRSKDWLQSGLRRLKSFYLHILTRLPQNNPWSYYHLAKAHLQDKNWQEAETLFRKCLKLDNTIALAHHELGDVLQQQKRFEEAIDAYRQAIAINPDFSWSHHNLGDALMHQKDWDGAILAYNNAKKLAPDCLETHHNLAKAYTYTNNLEEAATAYQAAILLSQKKSQPTFQILYDYAGVLLRLNDKSTLSDVYLKTIDVDPEFSWFYHFVFWKTLKDENRLQEAEAAYKQALIKHQDSSEVYINLGEALSHQDKISDALPYYQQALQNQMKVSYPALVKLCESSASTSEIKTSPDFIILGAQKAGTSSLYMYLTQHPNIIPALRKEVEFWSWKYRRGHDWYFAQFPPLPTNGTFLTGEACPGYLDFYVTAERIQQFLPSVKFIVLLRNPVDRAISHYHHWVRRQQETLPLSEAISAKRRELEEQGSPWDLPSNYIARGIYVDFFKHWFSIFPREQFLIIKSEYFYENPGQSLDHVYEFFGLPTYQLSRYKKYNSGQYAPAEVSVRQKLAEFYKPYNQELSQLLDSDFTWKL